MGIIKRQGVLITILLSALILTAFFVVSDTFATDSMHGDTLHAVTLTYDEDVVDIYNNAYVISIDDQKDLTLDFDVDEGWSGVKTILLRNIAEDGETKNVCETGTRQCVFNATKLMPHSGLEIMLYDWDDNVVRQTMLGLIIKQNATKEDYEIPLSIGPDKEIKIDMGTISTGMNFSFSPVPLPVKFEHYPDGRSVIGVGTNSTDAQFWSDAANNKMPDRISKSDMYKKWKETKKHDPDKGGLGFVWTIAGYATSYDNHPEKMTGTLQFYVGTGYNVIGQYAILTYSMTITIGADGEFSFTIDPSSEERVTGYFDLGVSAGLELYGGIGSGWLASVGVYGAGKFSTKAHVLPEFDLYSVNVAGEIGMKAKVLGRTVLTFTFISGSREFIDNVSEENGVTTYTADLNLKDVMIEKRDELVDSGYANKPAGKIETPDGETKWSLENLDKPTKKNDTALIDSMGLGSGPSLGATLPALSDAPGTQIANDYDYAHRIAENVYAHSGTQIIKHPTKELNAVAVFANNGGELNYSIYDGPTHQMSEPQPVAGSDGQDFGARFTRGFYPDQSYLVWRRLKNDGSDGASLSEVAKSGEIMIAKFNPDDNSFEGQEYITLDSDVNIYGGVGVTTGKNEADLEPFVFAYTNAEYDPEGLIDGDRNIMLFRKTYGEWEGKVIKNLWGTIASFDVGIYDGKPSVAYTLWNDFADVTVTHVVDVEGHMLAAFENAWGAQFVNKNGEPTLAIMQDGKLYSSVSGGVKTLEFGDDDNSLPNAPFKIIGDLGETFMVSYLSNVDSHQNLVGYVKANGTCSYEPVAVTNVNENSNVTYYDGLFIGDSAFIGDNAIPFIIYTVQNYQQIDSEFVEGQSDMYAMAGAATNHISVLASDITNLRELGVETNVAKVDILLRNTGLFHVDKFSLYLKNRDESSDRYAKLEDYNIPTLSPGETYQLELELPEADYTNPRMYVLGATSRDSEYAEIGVQSEHLIEAYEGPVQIVDLKYDFHNRGNHDAYTVTAKSLGPGYKNGKLVYYNTVDKTVYKEVPFNDLAPGSEIVDTIENSDDMLSATYEHLAVRVAKTNENTGDDWPSDKLRHMELLPAWFKGYINKVGGRNINDMDIIVPNTGVFTRVVAVGIGSATMVILGVSIGALRFVHRRKK
ncbi:MAG: hypothetical protein Q4A36_03630 [Candidatus Saccharibacteria bacterium]|nr:hypothetical protein [Candidatus Saccharibacteria bacterium]